VYWDLRPIAGQKGQPIGVYPLAPPAGAGSDGKNNPGHILTTSEAKISEAYFCRPHQDVMAEMSAPISRINPCTSEEGISADESVSERQKYPPVSTSNGADVLEGELFLPPVVHQRENAENVLPAHDTRERFAL
jgi:hypothetical protein